MNNPLSRRDTLKLAAAGVAAPWLSALPLTGAPAESSRSRRSGTDAVSSRIKVGQENSTPIELYVDRGLPQGHLAQRCTDAHLARRRGTFVELKDGPHGVLWTHAEQVNAQLVSFLV